MRQALGDSQRSARRVAASPGVRPSHSFLRSVDACQAVTASLSLAAPIDCVAAWFSISRRIHPLQSAREKRHLASVLQWVLIRMLSSPSLSITSFAWLASVFRSATLLNCVAAPPAPLVRNTLIPRDRDRLERCFRILVREHADTLLSECAVASQLGISSSRLSHLLIHHHNVGFREHLKSIRLHNALILLREKDLAIKQIAGTVGYSCVSTFCRDFVNAIGLRATVARTLVTTNINTAITRTDC
jgi:AraC-like DNA-binding protein